LTAGPEGLGFRSEEYRSDKLEAQLRSTEAKLQEQMRELEELRARIRALRIEHDRNAGRGGAGAMRSGGLRPPGAGPGGGGGRARGGWAEPVPVEIIEEPVEPIGRSIARELVEIREAPPTPEPVEPPAVPGGK
jgi:hypothetical protein